MAYDYDVAISFLAADEPLARDLAQRLAPLRVFVYSKKQEKLAGTEGVEAFRTVFRERAMLAVVLFRPRWGQTPWTRVEEAAIRDHCLAEGWTHQMFVQLEKGARPPKWVPDSFLYMDLQTFGIADLVGAIKARCMELGVELRVLSAAETAKQIAQRERFDSETAQIIRTTAQPLYDAAAATFHALQSKIQEIASGTGWSINHGFDTREFVAFTTPVSVALHTEWLAIDSEANLVCEVVLGRVLTPEERRQYRTIHEPTPIRKLKLKLVRTEHIGWCWESHDRGILTAEAAAEWLAAEFVDARRRQSPVD